MLKKLEKIGFEYHSNANFEYYEKEFSTFRMFISRQLGSGIMNSYEVCVIDRDNIEAEVILSEDSTIDEIIELNDLFKEYEI